MDPTITLAGPHGPVTLLEVFEGRRQLIAYFHMWHADRPAADQCEGCTFYNSQVRELSHLHSRDVSYATFCQGPYDETVRYRDFMSRDARVLGAGLRWRPAGRSPGSACSTWCATCAAATGCSRRTGPRPRRRSDGPYLRAGVPIVSPKTEGLLVIPVAPHSAFNRALMLAYSESLTLELLPSSGSLALEVDGELVRTLQPSQRVDLAADVAAGSVVRLGNTTFYQRVRRKLRLSDAAELG